MECIIIREITEIILGIVMIIGFFSRRFRVMYKLPFSLIIGSLFITASLIEFFSGFPMEFFEFLAAIILLLMVEKFITANTKSAFRWYYFVILTGITIAVVLLKRDIKYFHVGVLITLGTASMRTGHNVGAFYWQYKEIFYLSAIFGFLAAGTYMISLYILSDFLYFGGVMLFLSVIPELTPLRW